MAAAAWARASGQGAMVVLEGRLVRLRTLGRGDVPDLARFSRDYEVQRLSSHDEAIYRFEQGVEEWVTGLPSKKDMRAFAIETVEGGRLIGFCELVHVDWRCRSAMLGIEIGDHDAWGRGYGTEAVRILLRVAFDGMGLNRVEAGTFEFNPRAVRCLEKAGFAREGVLRQSVYREGRFWDEVVMGILAEDWRARG